MLPQQSPGVLWGGKITSGAAFNTCLRETSSTTGSHKKTAAHTLHTRSNCYNQSQVVRDNVTVGWRFSDFPKAIYRIHLRSTTALTNKLSNSKCKRKSA